MNKRQMLEFAADAARIKILAWHNDCPIIEFHDLGYVKWNPLEDDADAFRLSVTLSIDVAYGINKDGIVCVIVNGHETFCEDFKNDDFATVRYAITEYAANMGLAIK